MTGSGPSDISSAWDAFFHDWVKPVVHFGTPALIVFAVLLILTRVLTGRLVTKDSPGIRSAKTSARWPVSAMYWFGVICLLYAAIEATVIFPSAPGCLAEPLPPTAIPRRRADPLARVPPASPKRRGGARRVFPPLRFGEGGREEGF